MGLPKKGTRTIDIDNHIYRWKLVPSDSIFLFVQSEENNGQLMQASFDHAYKDDKMEEKYIVTPGIVRKAIIYGLENGWNPLKPGPKINFRDLNRALGIW